MKELSSGSTLGRYELLVRLGQGGMASVWVARRRTTLQSRPGSERLLAVKAMLPELARNSDFRTMFLEEGQIVRSIDHPNVVKVHDVGEHDGTLYMAMDWVEGDSLRALIREARKRRPIPPEMAVKIIADAASGLHAAHELRGWDGELRNLVHCDVSPHNILIGLDGQAKIVDFGVANVSLHSDFAADERVKGKFAYMSPEQVRGAKLDRRSDVFSLGIVLFELTTGERLFRGENPAHTLALVTSGKVPDPRRVLEGYPARLAEITLRALERDRDRRFQTAEALRLALEGYLKDERIVVSRASLASLARRVLAPRVESLRENLRTALSARGGPLPAELRSETKRESEDEKKPGTKGSDNSGLSNPRSTYHSGTPRPQTFETPVPERTNWAPIVAALGGVAAAAASILWVLHRPSVALVKNPDLSAASRTANGVEPAQRAGSDSEHGNGVDVGTLPLLASATSAVATAPPSRAASARGAARPARAGKGASASSELTTSSQEPAAAPPERAPPTPAGIVLEEQPVAPPPAAAPAPPPAVAHAPATAAGPFSRGSAMAQLGAAASRAGGCKRAGGPTGSGRATVTFSPDGGVSKVSVSPPFAGTSTGSCLNGAFSAARVPAFTGSAVTLPWSFKIPD